MRRMFHVVVFLLAVAAAVVVRIEGHSTVRLLVVLAFFLSGPGAATLAWMRLRDPFLELAAVVAVSIAVVTGVSMGMVYLDGWTATAGVEWLAVGTALVLLVRVLDTDGIRPPGVRP
jgi:hypothetical protein